MTYIRYGFGCFNCRGVVKSAFLQMQAWVLLLWLLLVDSLSISTARYKLLQCSANCIVSGPECCIVSCLLGASWTVNSPTLAPTLYHLGILTCHQWQYFSRTPLCRRSANSLFANCVILCLYVAKYLSPSDNKIMSWSFSRLLSRLRSISSTR